MSESWNQGGTPPPPPNYGGPAYGAPMSNGDHPDGVKALVISIIGLLCCTPLAIWSFIITKNAKAEGTTDSKITIAYVLSIIALVWFAVQIVLFALSLLTGGLSFSTGGGTYTNY